MLFLFVYLDFDVCASCYNEGSSAIEIQHHKMDHPVVKWTLEPQGGQRQWTHLEAQAVLEDLRTNVRVGDAAGDRDVDDDGGGDDVKKGGKEEGVVAAGAAVAAELGLDIYETDSEAGKVPPFPDDETMENLNEDAEETEPGNQAKDEDEEGEEGGDGEQGGVIAAGAVVAAQLGLDVGETNNDAGEVHPSPHDETMENLNQDAEETETGDQAKDESEAVDGGEEVVQLVQDPVALPSPYTCGRCSEDIHLESTFYRCVGHSCRGAFTPQSWIF